ncbi:SDR family oxidoreductase [Thermogemmatispora onikobensis]|uniref:SDR family oxidoreductase n=1 Tax=Thermogemmatispora onikobensis TaxID=732234 RepID=UPI000B14A455|nr:SDR family oxidoreductase [Thermogemmatispora onikobensis]
MSEMVRQWRQALQKRVVAVTGAGSGLGEATARAFAAAGCYLACLDINLPELQRVGRELEEASTEVLTCLCDVSQEAAVAESVAAILGRWQRLDILVNCAAVDHTLPVEELSVGQWDQVLGVNLRGPFLLARAVFPPMRAQGGGHIINVASTAALRAWANASAYHASKWGLLGFSRGLSVEGRPYGIRVTTIIPGGMRTHFFDRFLAQGLPLPQEEQLQDPATVAETIVFAASLPPESALQELLVTPFNETSWP